MFKSISIISNLLLTKKKSSFSVEENLLIFEKNKLWQLDSHFSWFLILVRHRSISQFFIFLVNVAWRKMFAAYHRVFLRRPRGPVGIFSVNKLQPFLILFLGRDRKFEKNFFFASSIAFTAFYRTNIAFLCLQYTTTVL